MVAEMQQPGKLEDFATAVEAIDNKWVTYCQYCATKLSRHCKRGVELLYWFDQAMGVGARDFQTGKNAPVLKIKKK